MADIRIKDLTTTASSTASDDFIAVDGTTNGTRKLSAFSPTFGGDPTVTGTLTVNGTSLANGLVVNGNGLALNSAGSASVRFQDAGTSKWWVYKLNADPNLYFRDMVNGRMQMTFVPNATSGTAISYLFSNLVVDSTAASTTTSTGALVVGNGTSGGLGVGGSITAGDNITSVNPQGRIQINGTGNTTGVKTFTLLRSDGADSFDIGLTGTAYNGALSAGGLGNQESFLYNSSATAFRIFIGTASTNRFDFTSSQFKINPTTVSTSTSSGALVVSGGVGVAGSIYAGATAKIGTATNYVWCGGLGDGAIHSYRTGADGYLRLTRGGVRDWDLFGGTNFTIAPDSGSAVLTLTSAGALTLGSSVQTSAPSGGTAAAWKLGTVASVSPTSPNRTIEVDIGGTIYYIHAKTTNN